MVETANKTTAIVKNTSEKGIYSANACAVIPAPSKGTPSIITVPNPSPPYSKYPPKLNIIITNAVMVQITTVSINGSKRATNPSLAEYLVFTAE